MEDDVSAIVEVMQVVPTVETSVAKDVIQQQLLKRHQKSESIGRKSLMAGLYKHTNLHYLLLLCHIVLQDLVWQWSSSAHWRSEAETGSG